MKRTLMLPGTLLRYAGAAVLLLGITGALQAQSSYTFTHEQAPYAELENATVLAMPKWDSVETIDLGQSPFSFFKRPYQLTGSSALEVSGYGFVRAWNDSNVMVIDGLFTPMDRRDSTSSVSYLIEGKPGELVLKVQWKNAGFPDGLPTDAANFQIWLYQSTGVIELRYGSAEVKGPEAFKTNGPWAGAFISPSDFTKMTEKCWITGNPAAPAYDTTRTFNFRRITAPPSPGTLYRLTPRTVAGVKSRSTRDESLLIPNPTHGTVHLSEPLGAPATVRIWNSAGDEIRRIYLEAGSSQLSLNDMPPGAYMVQFDDGARRVHSKLVVH